MNEPVLYIILFGSCALCILLASLLFARRSRAHLHGESTYSLLGIRYSERKRKLSLNILCTFIVGCGKGAGERKIRIKRTLFLSDRILESLPTHPSEEIRSLCQEIIAALGQRIRVPAWYKLNAAKRSYESDLRSIEDQIRRIDEAFYPVYNDLKNTVCKEADKADLLEKELTLTESKLKSLQKSPCAKSGTIAKIVAFVFFSKRKRTDVLNDIDRMKSKCEQLSLRAFIANENAHCAMERMLSLAHERSISIFPLEARKRELAEKYERDIATIKSGH